MSDFETFWDAYPRRVAKGHARTAFDKAIRKTDLATMLSAIADYIRFKPERIDFKHPATWLNSEGWSDEWQAVPKEVTNRRRTFTDVALDRFNGSAGFQGTDANAGGVSPVERQPGYGDERIRIGSSRPAVTSRH